MEDELRTKLFDRSKQNLALAPAGECFLKEPRQILSHVQRAAQLAQATSRGEAGQLSIAILPPIGELFLPPAIGAFRERFPVVDLTILGLLPQEQIAALIDRRIDIGFVPLTVVEMNPAIEFEPVREVELMVTLSPGHRLAKQHRLMLRKLAIRYAQAFFGCPAARLGFESMPRGRIEARVTKFADGPTSTLELVSAVWRGALAGDIREISLGCGLPPSAVTTPKFHLSLVWRRDNESPLRKSFLEILRTRFRKPSRCYRAHSGDL